MYELKIPTAMNAMDVDDLYNIIMKEHIVDYSLGDTATRYNEGEYQGVIIRTTDIARVFNGLQLAELV